MRVRSSNNIVKGLVCVDPLRKIYKLRWDISEGSYEEIEISHKPTLDEIKQIVESWYNKQTEDKIINGFTYKGYKVYLSKENQTNYILFADSDIIPVQVKFGTLEDPIYYVFNTQEELKQFKAQIASHINKCLQDGWNRKKNINWSIYNN